MLAAMRRKSVPQKLHLLVLDSRDGGSLHSLVGSLYRQSTFVSARRKRCRSFVAMASVHSLVADKKDPGRAELTHEYLTSGRVLLDLPLEAGGSLQVTAHNASEYGPESKSAAVEEWRVLRFKPADGVSDLLQSVSKVLVMPPNSHRPTVLKRPGVLSLAYTKSFVSTVLAVLNSLDVPVLSPACKQDSMVSKEQKLRILCIGLGGGCVPSFLAHHLPHCEVEVIELEPAVVHAAKEMGFVPVEGHLSVKVADGAKFALDIAKSMKGETTNGVYDAVLVDAYDAAGNVPETLYSRHSPLASALSNGLLRKRGSLIATNFLPCMDLTGPFQAYRNALPADCASGSFSIQAEGSGNLIAVQVCGAELSNDAAELTASLQQSAADVGRAIGCAFDMSVLAARNLQTWPATSNLQRSD